MKVFPLLCLLTLLFYGCNTNQVKQAGNSEPVELNYAAYFTITHGEGFTEVVVRNPWDATRVLQTYLLVPRENQLPAGLPEGTVVRTPLKNSLVYSAVHCSLLRELGVLGSVGGVCDLQYFRMPEILQAHAEGKLTDAGDSMSPDIEKIIDMNPDAVLLSPFENSGGYGRIDKMGIPIIECADYMEVSPLARAEWILFYGLLYGCEAKAEALFKSVEKNYLELAEKASAITPQPTVISELKSGAAWYVPGGQSTMSILFRDGGADYFWKDNANAGSVPLAFEVVFDKAHQADFWLIKYFQEKNKTYKEIEQEYAPYALFKAFKEKNIYGCNTAETPYYEETPFRPDWLLEDMIRIFHPDLLPEGELRYYSRLTK